MMASDLPLPVRFGMLEDAFAKRCTTPESMHGLCPEMRVALDNAKSCYASGEDEKATHITDELAKLLGVWF